MNSEKEKRHFILQFDKKKNQDHKNLSFSAVKNGSRMRSFPVEWAYYQLSRISCQSDLKLV